jgi:hypothetical protein
VLVAERTPERVRPLSEVRAQVEAQVLAEERAALREAWLADLRERIEVEEFMAVAPGAPDPATFSFPAVPDELEGVDGVDPDAPPTLEVTPDETPDEAPAAGDADEDDVDDAESTPAATD